MTSVHRVLVAEDHEPFRHVLCELLGERPDVQIVGESADGLDAVRQAEALQPDVVLLDIGLPTLSGIEVADRLRTVIPDARLMFVTAEASLEVVDLAFRRGVHGFVYKARAALDVHRVFDAIVRGGRFVSGGLERLARGDSLAGHRHDLMFCSSDAVLVDAFSRFIAGQLGEGHSVVVLVTEAHDAQIQRSLHASKVDRARALREQRYIPLNITELLASVVVDGWPDEARFVEAADELLAAPIRSAARRGARVTACGECAPRLWADGHLEAAIQLEHLWDQLAIRHDIDTLCIYPRAAKDEHVRTVRNLCAAHTLVEIT